jgi:hypothetical protein
MARWPSGYASGGYGCSLALQDKVALHQHQPPACGGLSDTA